MTAHLQFSGTLQAGQYTEWVTSGWPRDKFVQWSVRPSVGQVGNVTLRALTTEAVGDGTLNYHLTVWNIGTTPVNFEALYFVVTYVTPPVVVCGELGEPCADLALHPCVPQVACAADVVCPPLGDA